MSESLCSIEGKYEKILSLEDKTVEYKDAQLHITQFYGGEKRGTCFQITIMNGAIGTLIQLTAQQYYELVDEMGFH